MLGLDVALTDLGREIGGLRTVPRTEIAVLDGRGRCWPTTCPRVAARGDQARMRPLSELGVPSLMAVHAGQPGRASRAAEAQGEEWLGPVQPLQSMRWRGFAPVDGHAPPLNCSLT